MSLVLALKNDICNTCYKNSNISGTTGFEKEKSSTDDSP
jgi:hypothetical protein